jgi:hypothetical protein
VISNILAKTAKILSAATVAAGMMAAATATPAAAATKVGVLQCDVAGGVGFIIGSQKSMTCVFTPDVGPVEQYTGAVTKFGLDIGVTAKTVVVWAVLVTGPRYQPRSLVGNYGGVSAEASVVVGAGANALIGGNNNSIVLQPLSVQGQAGVNLAVGVTNFQLN